MVSGMTESHEGAVTHPSGWWKASDGNWYPPDQQPGASEHDPTNLVIGATLAVVAIVLASVINGNVAVLLWGTAAAFITRWWVFERPSAVAN